MKQRGDAAVYKGHGARQFALRHAAQHKTKDQRLARHVKKFHQVANKPDGEHYHNLRHRHVDSVRTDNGKADHKRAQYRGRYLYEPYAEAGDKEADRHKYDVGDKKAHYKSVDDRSVLRKERRSGLQAVDHQASEQNGRYGVAGDAQRQRRD